MTAVLVAAAGAAGVLARYGIGRAVEGPGAAVWATVAINVAGSFALGLLVGGRWLGADAREVVGIGFLGGFTTFSTFSVQIVADADGGRPARALAYLVASVVGGVLAAAAGWALARRLG